MGIRETFSDNKVRTLPEAVNAHPQGSPINPPKRNHFVPCFYSSLWASENGQLCEFTRPYDRVKAHRKHPSATGYSLDLYTEAALPDGPRTYLEDSFLKLVDQRASDALQLILADRIRDMSVDLRCGWARFIMSMNQRSPGKIAEIRKLWKVEYRKPDEQLDREYQAKREPTAPPTLAEAIKLLSPESAARGQVRLLQMVMDLPRVGTQIIRMHWEVLSIPDVRFNFLTSDRPIIMTNGIGTPEGHIAVPIGPRKLFLAANKKETIDQIARVPPCDLIMDVNAGVVGQAEKFVYGDSDFAVNFVEKRFRRST